VQRLPGFTVLIGLAPDVMTGHIKGGNVMAFNPTIVKLDSIPDAQPIASETWQPKTTNLLQVIEELLCKAFGNDEETIANSLRGL
jgi:hypothetical protein